VRRTDCPWQWWRCRVRRHLLFENIWFLFCAFVRLICVKIWCSCRKSRSVSSSTFWLRRVVQRFAAILIWSRIVSINLFDEFIDLDLIFRIVLVHFLWRNFEFWSTSSPLCGLVAESSTVPDTSSRRWCCLISLRLMVLITFIKIFLLIFFCFP
jgi:hypothetical protein